MRLPSIVALVAAAAVIFGMNALGASDALAQDTVKKPAAAAQKKAPGKTCSDIASNTQAHKDCIAQQAKSEKAANADSPRQCIEI